MSYTRIYQSKVVSYIRYPDLCSSLEDMPDVEKNAELLAIDLQELYVLGALDKAEQAKTLGARIAIDKYAPSHRTTEASVDQDLGYLIIQQDRLHRSIN